MKGMSMGDLNGHRIRTQALEPSRRKSTCQLANGF